MLKESERYRVTTYGLILLAFVHTALGKVHLLRRGGGGGGVKMS
jgi:hypothetical protein